MRTVPWWALLSSAVAPVVLIAGWQVVQIQQPASYDPIHDTLSTLRPVEALDRGILIGGPVAIGICQIVTAVGLRPLAAVGRLVLAFGGAALALTAAFPQWAGSVTAHGIIAGAAFLSFALWPLATTLGQRTDSRSGGPWPTRPGTARAASLGLMALIVWFGAELFFGAHAGLAERASSAADVLWPLAVVVGCRCTRPPPADEFSRR